MDLNVQQMTIDLQVGVMVGQLLAALEDVGINQEYVFGHFVMEQMKNEWTKAVNAVEPQH